MREGTQIRSNSVLKKAIAVLCVMFTIVGMIACLGIKPMNASAATSASYTCSYNGGSTGYYNRSVSSYSASASWISVRCTGYGSYTVNVSPSYNINSIKSSRFGYVTFKNGKNNLHTIYIYQTNPYLCITTSKVAIPNFTNGTGYFNVTSNVQFSYWTDDQYGVFKPCSGQRGTNLGAPRYYNSYNSFSIPVVAKSQNTIGEAVDIDFYVKAIGYNFTRKALAIQNSTPVEQFPKGKVTYQCSQNGRTYTLTADQLTEGNVTFTISGSNFPEFTKAKCDTYVFKFKTKQASGRKYLHADEITTSYNKELIEEGWDLTNIGSADVTYDGKEMYLYLYKHGEWSDIVNTYHFYLQ